MPTRGGGDGMTWPYFKPGDRVTLPTGRRGLVVGQPNGALTPVQLESGQTQLFFSDILRIDHGDSPEIPSNTTTTRSRKPRRAIQRVHSAVDSDRD